MQTLPKACLVWGGVGILAAGFHLYYLAMIGMVLVGVAVQQLLRRRGGALALLPIVSYCATALVELFVWGAFASNFADSEGLPYMYAVDLAGLFIPQFSDTFETNIFVGPRCASPDWGCTGVFPVLESQTQRRFLLEAVFNVDHPEHCYLRLSPFGKCFTYCYIGR